MKNKLQWLAVLCGYCLLPTTDVASQSVGIGTATPSSSAQLEVASTSKGVLFPRMTKAQRTAIASPADGLLVFQTGPDSIGFYYRSGSSWVWLQNATGPGSGWSTTGNAGTDTSVNFLGTVDNKPLALRINNTRAGILGANQNTSFGLEALSAMQAGAYQNDAFGYRALDSLTTGKFNTAMGAAALSGNKVGELNVAVGGASQYFGNANYNTSMGVWSLGENKTGEFNTAMGYQSQMLTREGYSNTSVGAFSMYEKKKGANNVAMGIYALEKDTASDDMVAVGSQALRFSQSRPGNTAVGANALMNNTNTANVLATQGSHNTALGYNALTSNLRGSGGVAIGYQALYSDTAANGTVAIGRNALFNNNAGRPNLAIGDSALFTNGNTSGPAEYYIAKQNIAIGAKALKRNDIGNQSVAIGFDALANSKNSWGEIAIGDSASYKLGINSPFNAGVLIGSPNTIIGNHAFKNVERGYYNVAIGTAALFGNPNKSISDVIDRNIAIGNGAMGNVESPSNNNVAIGYATMDSISTGNQNIAIGTFALRNVGSASKNVVIGYEAGRVNIGEGNTFIGYQAARNAKSANKLYIENSEADSLSALIYGDFAADSLLLNAKTINRNLFGLRGIGANTGLELGYGVFLKEPTAGRIGYRVYSADALDITGAGNTVGTRKIKLWADGGTAINGNTDIDGFTRLGTAAETAPRVKMKTLSGTTALTNTGTINIAHGLTSSKIITVQALVDLGGGTFVPTAYTYAPELNFNYLVTSANIVVVNNASTCAGTSICNKPVKLVITYTE